MSTITASLRSANKPWVPIAVLSGVVLLAAVLATPSRHLHQDTVPARTPEMAYPPAASPQAYTTRPEKLAAGDMASVSPPTGLVSAQLKSSAPAVPAAAKVSAAADRKIVRTGALELTVRNPADAAEQIRLMAEAMGGYLESAQIGGSKEALVANITIRVPATHFEDAKAGIRKLAARVENEKTDAQDVTRQYVDIEARLRNLRAEEAQYLAIMKSAYKVEDLIEVSQKVSEVRGEIEQQQAEFQALSKQVETVAITVSLRAFADAQVFGLTWRPLYQLKVAARDGLDALADYASAMTAILCYVPVILAWSLTILFAGVLGWRLVRWGSRRLVAAQAAGVPEKATGSI
jgi:hypothetical protein